MSISNALTLSAGLLGPVLLVYLLLSSLLTQAVYLILHDNTMVGSITDVQSQSYQVPCQLVEEDSNPSLSSLDCKILTGTLSSTYNIAGMKQQNKSMGLEQASGLQTEGKLMGSKAKVWIEASEGITKVIAGCWTWATCC